MKNPETLVGVWFVYNGQVDQLRLSVEKWREVSGAKVVFFNDAASPLSESAIAALAPDHVELTLWPRNRNLNGWAAAHGVLDSLGRACAVTDSTHAVKIDCDTLVLSTDWIDRSSPFSGFHYGQGAWAAGLAYAVSSSAIQAELADWDYWWRDPDYRAPEDVILTGRFIQRYGPECALHDHKKGFAGSYFGNIPAARYSKAQVLTFQKCRMPQSDLSVMRDYALGRLTPADQ